MDRRTFLQVSALAGIGAGATIQQAQAGTKDRIMPLVIFFQGGAQSPYEFVSPIDGVSEFRGDVSSARAQNGALIDSRWVHTAQVLDKASVIKSLNCANTSHDARHVVGNDMQKRAPKFAHGGIPHPFVELPSVFSDRAQLDPNIGFHIQWNAKQKRFAPPPTRPDPGLRDRLKLLRTLESGSRIDGPAVELMEANRELAASLLLGGDKLQRPFNEAERKLDRYGDNEVGRSAALASSFAQSGAGISFVYNERGPGWDMHNKIKERSDELIIPTDIAVAELIKDAHREGFLLLVTSEHGRTPRINSSGGRDYHNVGYAVLAGPGVQMGVTYGDIDSQGEIAEDPVKGNELMNSLYYAAGADVLPNAPRIRQINTRR
tara:strand:+ start:289 stop:1416 length:1128 start_codon:yes stop_codon:yes gene_type:complete